MPWYYLAIVGSALLPAWEWVNLWGICQDLISMILIVQIEAYPLFFHFQYQYPDISKRDILNAFSSYKDLRPNLDTFGEYTYL